jgi:hypothetical protein
LRLPRSGAFFLPAGRPPVSPFVAIGVLAAADVPQKAGAGCQEQLRILADDLHEVRLDSRQTFDIAAAVLEAQRYCWIQQEKPAMVRIARARTIAGLKPPAEDSDWETVPLESLEKA